MVQHQTPSLRPSGPPPAHSRRRFEPLQSQRAQTAWTLARRKQRVPSLGKDRCGANEREAGRGMGLAGESGGVAGRAELPGARGPDHPAVCCAVPRRKVRRRGDGLGRAVWPEGRELKLNTASERIVPFPCSFPLPPPSLNPLARAPRERSGPAGRGGRACRGGAGAQAREGRGAECKGDRGPRATPDLF